MSDITIQVLSTIGECNHYMPSRDGDKETVSFVVSPLKVHNTGGDNLRLKFDTGCNMFEGCFDYRCYFSAASRIKNVKPVG